MSCNIWAICVLKPDIFLCLYGQKCISIGDTNPIFFLIQILILLEVYRDAILSWNVVSDTLPIEIRYDT